MKEEKTPITPIYFTSQKQFRKWLENNHDKVDFVWLKLKKKDSKNPCINYVEAVEESLCFGWIDGQVKSLDKENYIQRFTPRKKQSLWSKINRDKASKLMKEGRMTEAGLKKIEEAKSDGRWENAYTTVKNLSIPDDLKQSLEKVPGALEAFNAFAPSHQNMYIHWLNDAKKAETRTRRIEKVILWSLEKKNPGFL